MLETHGVHPEDKEQFDAARFGQEKQAVQACTETSKPVSSTEWPAGPATLSPAREKAAQAWTAIMQARIATATRPEPILRTTSEPDSPDQQ